MKTGLCLLALGCLGSQARGQGQTVQILVTGPETPISPFIYGANEWCNASDVPFTSSRWGGNRQTGYNWENNASNAGADYIHSSDEYLVGSLPKGERRLPARAVETVHATASARKQYLQATVQLAGYVAADFNGTVTEAETAPSARWKKVVFEKTGALSLTPDLGDGEVYMDEFVNYVTTKVGKSAAGGIQAWSLDNEPGLWRFTHPRIHPMVLNVASMIGKSAAAAKAIKKVDADAEVYGPACYGWGEMKSLDGGDWTDTYSKQYDWYISAYLALMKAEGEKAGKRLLDVLDFHWYPEAQGDCRIIIANTCDQVSDAQAEARIQSPRSLWDSTYVEKSWITQTLANKPINLLPLVKKSIAAHYPGTKVAITEYEYGGHDHWSGGLAQADFLGVIGREGVYMATLWSAPGKFTKSAFNIYLDYDGNGAAYGDLAVPAASENRAALSVFAARDSKDATKLHIMAINKTSAAQSTRFALAGGSFTSGTVHGFDEASGGAITQRAAVSGLDGSGFTYSLPPRSVLHFVLTGTAISVFPGLVPLGSSARGQGFFRVSGGNISIADRWDGDVSVRVSGPDGRMVRTQEMRAGQGAGFLGGLPAGYHVLRIERNRQTLMIAPLWIGSP